MKVRIRFEKFGSIRYIGHLDIMRYFHKALQRAHVDVSFSTGFHPHPIMSFASPLGVGLTSCGEYMDVEVGSCGIGADMLAAINEQMVPGMKVTGIRLLPDEGRKNNAMATVGQADYRVSVPGLEKRDWTADVEHFLGQKEILVHKKTKKSEKDVDIREWTLSFEARLRQRGKPEAGAGDGSLLPLPGHSHGRQPYDSGDLPPGYVDRGWRIAGTSGR